MRLNIKFLSFLIACYSTISAIAQNDFNFKRLTVDNGLSDGVINCIVQDYDGFIWFGTQDGLNRWDGYEFKVYKPDDTKTDTLCHNVVKSLYVDKDSILWVGTGGGGLSRYNREKDNFKSYRFIEKDPNNPENLTNNSVFSIFEDKFGMIWVGTMGGGVCVIDKKLDKVVQVFQNNPKDPHSLSQNSIRAIFEDPWGELWVGVDDYANGGLNKYDRKRKRFDRYQHDPEDSTSLGSNIVLTVLVDVDSTFWVGSWAGGISHFDPRTGTAKVYKNDPDDPHSISSNETFAFKRDRKGRLWVSTRNGLDIFNDKTERFHHFKNDPLEKSSLIQDVIVALYEDRSGVMWIGAEGKGINYYDTESKQFHHYKNDYKNPQSLAYNDVYAIAEDSRDLIWVGTKGGGISVMNKRSKKFTHFKHDPENEHSISNNSVNVVFEDSKGNMWFGFNGGGVDKYVPSSGMFTHYDEDKSDSTALSNSSIYCIEEDNDGYIWLGTFGGGVNRLNPNTGVFKTYTIDPVIEMSNVAWAMLVDSDGQLWVGSSGHGLLRYDKKEDKFDFFEQTESGVNSISHNVVSVIIEDDYGYLWIGTGGAGVDKLDKKNMSFQNFSVSDGLISDMIASLEKDDNGDLWVSTSKGISKFSISDSSYSFKNFDKYDGLQDNNFNPRASCKSKDGMLYMGGINGFNIFHPDSIYDNQTPPIVQLTDFSLFNVSQGPDVEGSKIENSIWATDEIKLSYEDYSFSFEFSALHFAASDKNGYKYMMENFDEDWISTTSERRFANYTNLSGGEYFFKVRATNNDGLAASEDLSIKIIIDPPYWETWWFWTIIGIAVSALIFGVFRLRERQSKLQKTELQRKINNAIREVEKQKTEIVKQNDELQKRKEEDAIHQWFTEGLANFAEILRNNKDNIDLLSRDILSNLVSYVGAVQGGLFVVNEDDPHDVFLQLVASYAYDSETYNRNRFEIGEGLVGLCYKDKDIKHFKDFPKDYLTIHSSLGKSTANELLIIPLKLDELIYGVIEIATLKEFRKIDIEFIEKLGESITSTLFTAKINIKTQLLLEQSRQQAEELKAQEEETRQNIEEMEANREEALRIKSEVVGYLNSVNHSVIRADFDLDGSLTYANSKFLDYMGYKSKEAYKLSVGDFFMGDERENFLEQWEGLLNGSRHIEEKFNHKTKEGSVVLLSTYTAVKDLNGEIQKILYLGLDVEGQMATPCQHEMKIVDKLIIHFELDSEGTISNPNNRFIDTVGIPVDELDDLHFSSLLKEDDLGEFDNLFAKLKETQEPFYFTFKRKTLDKELTHNLYFEAISEEGEIEKIAVFGTELTQL